MVSHRLPNTIHFQFFGLHVILVTYPFLFIFNWFYFYYSSKNKKFSEGERSNSLSVCSCFIPRKINQIHSTSSLSFFLLETIVRDCELRPGFSSFPNSCSGIWNSGTVSSFPFDASGCEARKESRCFSQRLQKYREMSTWIARFPRRLLSLVRGTILSRRRIRGCQLCCATFSLWVTRFRFDNQWYLFHSFIDAI